MRVSMCAICCFIAYNIFTSIRDKTFVHIFHISRGGGEGTSWNSKKNNEATHQVASLVAHSWKDTPLLCMPWTQKMLKVTPINNTYIVLQTCQMPIERTVLSMVLCTINKNIEDIRELGIWGIDLTSGFVLSRYCHDFAESDVS